MSTQENNGPLPPIRRSISLEEEGGNDHASNEMPRSNSSQDLPHRERTNGERRRLSPARRATVEQRRTMKGTSSQQNGLGGRSDSKSPSSLTTKSMEDRSHSEKERSHSETTPPLDPSIYERSHSETTPPLDPSLGGFLSDPSASEEEFVDDRGSSRMDYQKKLLYRQRLREYDAASVGDTSLSSSNLSPTPQRFRIQFDSDQRSVGTRSVGTRGSGKVRDRVRAASARLSLGSGMAQNGSEGGRPPSSSGKSLSDVPPLPNLERERVAGTIGGGEGSVSSADSVRGIGIGTEQLSGEPSYGGGDSGNNTNNDSNHQRPGSGGNANGSNSNINNGRSQRPGSNNISPRQSSHGDPSPPESHPAKRARRRSGDRAAATAMGREQWSGMHAQGLPLPRTSHHHGSSDGSSGPLGRTWSHDGSSGPLAYGSANGAVGPLGRTWSHDGSSGPFVYGSTNSHGGRMQWDGYAADVGSTGNTTRGSGSGDVPRRRSSGRGGMELGREGREAMRQYLRNDSAASADSFDFSESAGGGHPAYHHSNSDPNSRASWGSGNFDPGAHRSWDRGDRGDGRGHARYATHASGTSAMSAAGVPDQSHLAWLAAYQAEMHRNFIPNDYRESDGSDGSSAGSSASHTSSSYTDNSAGRAERGRHARHASRHVKFASMGGDDTKFDKVMRRVNSVLEKPIYRKAAEEAEATKEMPMFFCPNCKTKQRDFINFATASGSYEPQGYLALYFALYLVSSLFVFGLEEGWPPLDCVYYSVITLTTTGLGDFVPTSDAGKILCACFIYVGVATIGLLLGGLLAGSMDTARIKEAREAQIRDCPNCVRLEKLRSRPTTASGNFASFNRGNGYDELKENLSYTPSDASSNNEDAENIGLDLFGSGDEPLPKKPASASAAQKQIHTRHMSIDIGGRLGAKPPAPLRRRGGSGDALPTIIDEDTPLLGSPAHASTRATSTGDMGISQRGIEMRSLDGYSTSSSESSSSDNPLEPMTRVKAAKYTILTLNQALINSSFIIAAGSIGFYFIEGMSAVDSFYFTTVLLTTVGYGDIVPVTTEGKIFATIFVVSAGTVLLHNMTLISMIPLELRKRRVEHAVLGQFGDQLTDDELRELSMGRLINRLKLATNRPDGLEECTREMFSLAMLVRLGRISEEDIKATFAAFRRLDVGNYGTLNSRTIIEGEVKRRRSMKNLAAMAPPEPGWEQPPVQSYPPNYPPPPPPENYVYPGSPNPFFNPMRNSSGSLRRNASVDSYHSQSMVSQASSFDYNAYENWASHFDHYSPSIRGGDAYETWASHQVS